MPSLATTGTGDRIAGWISIYSVAVFALLWIGVAVSATIAPELPDDTWGRIEELPLVPRLAAWVLFLPIVLLLWISQRSMPTWQRSLAILIAVTWTIAAIASLARSLRAG